MGGASVPTWLAPEEKRLDRCRADPILARVVAYSYLSLFIQLDVGPSLLAFLSSLCGAARLTAALASELEMAEL